MANEVFCNPLHYVEAMKHKYFNTLTDWCCTELSHVLEFNGPEGLGQILAGNVNVRHGKTVTKKFSRSKKKAAEETHETGIFGAPLTSQGFCQTRQLIDFLRSNASKEGIFRIPGNSERQRRLKAKLNEGRLVDLHNEEFTAHDVACVLKTYLGELPEPLLTEKHYVAHVQAANLTYKLDALPNLQPDQLQRLKAKRQTDHITALTFLFLMLPSTNFKLLKELLELLYDVSKQQDVNKMTAYNLGVMFAPHVLWPRYLTTDELRDQEFICKLNCSVEFMIAHCHSIFKVPAKTLHKCEVFIRHGGILPEDLEDEIELANRTITMDHYDGGRRSTDMISAPERANIEIAKDCTDTEVALAQLYADVQAMPQSSKKRKLMKQFTKNSYLPGTPTRVRQEALKQMGEEQQHRGRGKHSRSKSLGEVISKGTPFSSKKKRPAPAPPSTDQEPIRMHNASREIKNEMQSRRYRQRANSCDALESTTTTTTTTRSADNKSTNQGPTLKPARPAPSTPDAKVPQRPVPAPRSVTPKPVSHKQRLADQDKGSPRSVTPKPVSHKQRLADQDRGSSPGVRPTIRKQKRNSDGHSVSSPRDTTRHSSSNYSRPVPSQRVATNKPVPKPRTPNYVTKENNPPAVSAAPRYKRESAL